MICQAQCISLLLGPKQIFCATFPQDRILRAIPSSICISGASWFVLSTLALQISKPPCVLPNGKDSDFSGPLDASVSGRPGCFNSSQVYGIMYSGPGSCATPKLLHRAVNQSVYFEVNKPLNTACLVPRQHSLTSTKPANPTHSSTKASQSVCATHGQLKTSALKTVCRPRRYLCSHHLGLVTTTELRAEVTLKQRTHLH